MPHSSTGTLLRHIRTLAAKPRDSRSSDRELLLRFAAEHDEDAFAALMQRHGPMVWRVCRRLLHDSHAAEDVFQATFLVLARKADDLERLLNLSQTGSQGVERLPKRAQAKRRRPGKGK